MFFYGLGSGLNFGLAMFMQEFMLESQRGAVQTFVQSVDGFTTMGFLFYCLYISKHW